MNSRHISVLAAVQVLTLSFAFLLATVAARSAERFWEIRGEVVSLPRICESAFRFRDYGWWVCLSLIAVWVAVAIHAERSTSPRYALSSGLIGLVLIFCFLGRSWDYFWAMFAPYM